MKANDNQSLFEVFKPGVLPGYTFWQKFCYWFKNVYWYHFKKHTIFALIAIVMVSFFIKDVVFRIESDLGYIIAGNAVITNEQCEKIKEYISQMAVDVNDDGHTNVTYQMLATNDADSYDQIAAAADEKFAVSLADDNFLFYITDDFHTETLLDEGAYEPLSTFGIESDTLYCIEITECELFKKLNIQKPNDGKWYIGVKLLAGTPREKDELSLRKYEVVGEVLRAFAAQ